MPGLATALFQMGVGEQAFPTDKTYIMPGFQVTPVATHTEMGIGSLMASHIFKPRHRDEPCLKPAPRLRTFEPVKTGVQRSMSLPGTDDFAPERRKIFAKRRAQSEACPSNLYGETMTIEEEIAAEVKEVQAEHKAEEERLQAFLNTPPKEKLTKKQKKGLKVMHVFGWILCCPLYTMVACVRESPDAEDEEDLRDDTCLPCYS